jgi:hypothetical protein
VDRLYDREIAGEIYQNRSEKAPDDTEVGEIFRGASGGKNIGKVENSLEV